MVVVRIVYPTYYEDGSKLIRTMDIGENGNLVLPPNSSVLYPEEWDNLTASLSESKEETEVLKDEKLAEATIEQKESTLKDTFKVTLEEDLR